MAPARDSESLHIMTQIEGHHEVRPGTLAVVRGSRRSGGQGWLLGEGGGGGAGVPPELR